MSYVMMNDKKSFITFYLSLKQAYQSEKSEIQKFDRLLHQFKHHVVDNLFE